MDPFQLTDVQVPHSLQPLQLRLDLGLLLWKDNSKYIKPVWSKKKTQNYRNTLAVTFLRWPSLSLKISSCSWYSACDNLSRQHDKPQRDLGVKTVDLGEETNEERRLTLHFLFRWSCFCVCFAPGSAAESEPWRAACAWPAASSAFRCPLAGNWSFLVAWRQTARECKHTAPNGPRTAELQQRID